MVPSAPDNVGVRFETLTTATPFHLGHIQLDQPDTLNALSLPMVDAIAAQLQAWAENDDIVAVVLSSTGDRAFCAGGDVQKLRSAILANQAAGTIVDSYAEDFFEREYRLDYRLHTYPKPTLCWGNGAVMGGGLGLFSASTYRVVTETSRLAWPEITIGLFPDAGGTDCLSRLPKPLGLFLALTGIAVGATDAAALDIATHQIAHERRPEVLQALRDVKWQAKAQADSHELGLTLNRFTTGWPDVEAVLVGHAKKLTRALAGDSTHQNIASALTQMALEGDWFARAVRTFRAGCPITAGIVIQQLARADRLSLAERFQMELVIAVNCARGTDFAEGVRALLVDKDKNPVWSYPTLEDLPKQVVESYFEPVWVENPLADLSGV